MSFSKNTPMSPAASTRAYSHGTEQAREAVAALRTGTTTAGIGMLTNIVMDLPTTPEGRRTLAGLLNEIELALT